MSDKDYLAYIDSLGGFEKLKVQVDAKNEDARKAWIAFMTELGPHIEALEAHPSWQFVKEKILLKKREQAVKNFMAVNFLEPDAAKQALVYKYMIAGIDLVTETISFYKKMIAGAKEKAKRGRARKAENNT